MSQWQDIFSVETWEILTGKKMVSVVFLKSESSHYIQADIPDTLGDQGRLILEKIYELIKLYHEIDKTDLNLFEQRIEMLKQIEAITQDYIHYVGSDLQCKKEKKIMGIHPNMKPKLGDFVGIGLGSIDIWVQSLHKRCQKKIHHLQKLQPYIIENPDYNEVGLRAMIIEAQHQDGKLYPGVLLEHIDLYHRCSEFRPTEIDQPDYRDDKQQPMNYAFNEWLVSRSTIPFFLWLEGHAISTAHRVLDADHRFVDSVDYNLPHKLIVKVKSLKSEETTDDINDSSRDIKSSGSPVFASKSPQHGGYTLFDSSQMKACFPGCWKPYTPRDSIAFVWHKSDKEIFITHPHKAGKYHHASLVNGDDVRCSGMWSVSRGKVTYLSNSSGHYRNSTLRFFKLVSFMNNKGVLSNEVKICDLTNKDEAGKSLNLHAYFLWAKEQPKIKDYLIRKNMKYERRLLDDVDQPVKANLGGDKSQRLKVKSQG